MASAKLIANDGIAYSQLGVSAAAYGNKIIVGSPKGDNDFGAAYIFSSETGHWNLEAELLPNTETVVSFFGQSVQLSNNVAFVTSLVQDFGAVEVF